VDERPIREKKVAFSNENGYVRTGPKTCNSVALFIASIQLLLSVAINTLTLEHDIPLKACLASWVPLFLRPSVSMGAIP